MAYVLTLKDLLSTMDKDIVKALDYDMRTLELNKRPHVLDISENSLSLSGAGNDKEHATLYKIFISIVSSLANLTIPNIDTLPSKLASTGAVYVISPPILVGKTYDSIQKFISKVVRDPKLVNTAYGTTITETDILNKKGIPSGDTKKSEVSKLDIGHIPTANSNYFVSPAAEKIASVLDILSVHSDPRVIKIVEDSLRGINTIQAEISYDFRKSSDSVFSSIEGKLGNLFVGVTLHSAHRNQREFGPRELEVFNKFKFSLIKILATPNLVNKYLLYNSSNSIIEDITQGLMLVLAGKPVRLKPHTNKSNKGSTPKFTSNSKVNSASTKNSIPKPSPIRTTSGQFYSLASLQMLINSQLQDVISANMGNGSDKKVLNYRTGRFAESAQVERMSQSREGMITAFYTYMKNPYQTFEPGFRQGKPASRDPKLLIGNSIKEIAATKVGNRLRAVLI